MFQPYARTHTRSHSLRRCSFSRLVAFLVRAVFRSGRSRVATQLRARAQRRRRLPRVDDDRRPLPLRVRHQPLIASPLPPPADRPAGRPLPLRTARRRVFVRHSQLPTRTHSLGSINDLRLYPPAAAALYLRGSAGQPIDSSVDSAQQSVRSGVGELWLCRRLL